jgi:alpha-galactosidase
MREISVYQSPGHWLDMDLLEVGNFNMTAYMQQTHFAFWAALKSPLIISADLRKMTNESLAVLTNKDIIALNQDKLGLPVNYIEDASIEGYLQVWAGQLNGGYAVLIFNEKSYKQTASVSFGDLGLGIKRAMQVKELWSGKSWGKISAAKTNLEPYQTLVFKLS